MAVGGVLQGLRRGLGEPSPEYVTEDEELSSLWRLDAIGIKERPDISGLDMAAVEQFESQVGKNGTRYEVSLMIQKPGLDACADNYKLAEERLRLKLRLSSGQAEYTGSDDTVASR